MECENCKKRFAQGFEKGQESVLRQNKSGCCCIIDDNEDVVSVCGAHENWLESVIGKTANEKKDRCIHCGGHSPHGDCVKAMERRGHARYQDRIGHEQLSLECKR